jgi:hypothetical protein
MSFETALNPATALELAQDFTSQNKDVAFILSSNQPVISENPNIIDGSRLTFRENAELTKYCDLFIGCASGISWLCTSTWAKKLNMILVINQNHNPFSSMIYDHEYLNLPTDHIIEIKSDQDSIEKLKNCLVKISNENFAVARKSFNEEIKLNNLFFLDFQLQKTFSQFEFGKFFSCLKRCVKRNGIQILFSRNFGKILKHLLILSAGKLKNLLNFGQKN